MISPSSSPIKVRQGRGLPASLAGQSGAFSPFMFGLIMGVTIFSAVAMQYAKQQLVEIQRKKTERARSQAEDMTRALDFAILSETKDTYQDDYTLNRAKQFASSSGKTVGDQDFQVTTQQSDRQSYGRAADKIAITASDDSMLRAQMYRTADERELDKLSTNAAQPVAVYDTSVARDRQIRTSNSRMEALAEQVYAYYAAHLKFPDHLEFEKLSSTLALHDAWGDNFEYTVAPDEQSAQLAFTTPWNYQKTLNLSLKDGAESAK